MLSKLRFVNFIGRLVSVSAASLFFSAAASGQSLEEVLLQQPAAQLAADAHQNGDAARGADGGPDGLHRDYQGIVGDNPAASFQF